MDIKPNEMHECYLYAYDFVFKTPCLILTDIISLCVRIYGCILGLMEVYSPLWSLCSLIIFLSLAHMAVCNL